MRKVILVLVALVLVGSGVAAVSAYEAHLINVTSHVENAMAVFPKEIDFGTVFPEEWLMEEIIVTTSESFCEEDQQRVTWIDYSIFAEWKPCPGMPYAYMDNAAWVQDVGYYNWMGYFTYVGESPLPGDPPPAIGDMTLIGPPPPGLPGQNAKWVRDPAQPLHKVTPQLNSDDAIWVAIDVPVFEGFWNDLTDRIVNDPFKPSGLTEPTYEIPEDMPGFDPEGMDFGLDLKIQVTAISATNPRL